MIKDNIKKDDWGIVLDFLSKGHYGMSRAQPAAQLLGDKYFSLLEVIVREDVEMKQGERVYIGDKKRDKVKYIANRMKVSELSAVAKDELERAIENIITASPEQFLEFFNKCGSLTPRQHQLELLPGIGKKHLWAIVDERKKKLFDSLEEIRERVPLIPDPKKMFVKRILEEMEDKDRYHIFVLKTAEIREQR